MAPAAPSPRLSATGSASPRPDRNSWQGGATACFLSGISGWFSVSLNPWRVGAEESGAAQYGSGGAVAEAFRYGVSFATTRSQQLAGRGYGVLSLRHFGLVLCIPEPLARGCRRVWRGAVWLRRRRRRGFPLRGQLRHDPIATAGREGLRRAFSPAFRAGS